MENGTRSWIPARRGREFSSHCTWVGTSHCCALALPLGLGYLCPFCVTSGFTGNWNLNTPPPLLPAFSLSNLDTFLLPSQPGLLRKECGPDVLRSVPWCPFGTAGSQGERGWGAGLTPDVSDQRGREGDSFCFLVFRFLRKFITNHKHCQQGLALQTFF